MLLRTLLPVATALVVTSQAQALEVGTLELAGNACLAGVGAHQALIENDHLAIPLGMNVKKDEDRSLVRSTCNFALPLKAAPGSKIVVSNAHQLVSLRAHPGSKASAQLEIFSAGSRGTPEVAKIDAIDKNEKLVSILGTQSAALETACGEGITLRGNLSAMAMGTTKARIFTKSLHLTVIEVPCAEETVSGEIVSELEEVIIP